MRSSNVSHQNLGLNRGLQRQPVRKSRQAILTGSRFLTASRFIFAGAAIFSLLLVYAAQRSPTMEPVADEMFDEVWLDLMKPLELKKASMERTAAFSTEPKPIKVERIVMDTPVIMPEVNEDEVWPGTPTVKRESNVCTRHHMRKVTTHNGRSWRCRK